MLVCNYSSESFFLSSRRRHTIFDCDWSSDVCSSDLLQLPMMPVAITARTVVRLVWSSITSPIALLYRFCHYIDYQSSILIRDLVTKPDYPDPWSIKGAIEDELDKDTIPGLGGSNLTGIEPEVDSSSS